MASTQLPRVQEIFEAALACTPSERPALIRAACGDDAELRAEVESLLEHESQLPADFLEPQPAGGAGGLADQEDPDALIGRRIGHYQIVRLIAAGGMGSVYEAVQEQPRRVVALKVLRQGVGSRSAVRRFESEAEILARLRHPNIAQVYEAGVHTEGGVRRPYFALEHVPEARTIIEFAQARRLDTPDRLRLLAKVCDAVHHGHQKGIIHRDLKPANILVDSAGEPKVIDFGVARVTEADVALTTQHTLAGQIVGTVQYMSPEQCDGDTHEIDTRSDVYSLGVVLYELLTSAPPYETKGSTIYAATRAIKEQAPPRPSTRSGWHGRPARELRGDIDTIVLKALEKDRDKRYASAADLAQDIRRHLKREPIEARPPGRFERVYRAARRRPLVATLLSCLSVALLVLVCTAAVFYVMNRRPHRVVLLYRQDMVSPPGAYEARLLSLGKSVLRNWVSPSPIGVLFGELIPRPRAMGGGRLVVLAAYGDGPPEIAGRVCAYDASRDLNRLDWRSVVTDEDLPSDMRRLGRSGEDCLPAHALSADVFPHVPGSEIVAVFTLGLYSQKLIRVYDLRGGVRYQVWWDGTTLPPIWLPRAGLLVFAAADEGPFWRDGDMVARPSGVRCGLYPQVVFALRPEDGGLFDHYVRRSPGDGSDHAVWCRRVLVGEAGAGREWNVASVASRVERGRSYEVIEIDTSFKVGHYYGAMPNPVLDCNGALLRFNKAADPHLAWNLAHPPGDPLRLPEAEDIRLVDWTDEHVEQIRTTGLDPFAPPSNQPAPP